MSLRTSVATAKRIFHSQTSRMPKWKIDISEPSSPELNIHTKFQINHGENTSILSTAVLPKKLQNFSSSDIIVEGSRIY